MTSFFNPPKLSERLGNFWEVIGHSERSEESQALC